MRPTRTLAALCLAALAGAPAAALDRVALMVSAEWSAATQELSVYAGSGCHSAHGPYGLVSDIAISADSETRTIEISGGVAKFEKPSFAGRLREGDVWVGPADCMGTIAVRETFVGLAPGTWTLVMGGVPCRSFELTLPVIGAQSVPVRVIDGHRSACATDPVRLPGPWQIRRPEAQP